MLFFQMIKGLCIALAELWKKLWRSSGKAMRWTVALLIVALVTVFAVKRYQDAFVEEPPEWLQQRDMTSPSLPSATWEQFQPLLELADRYATQHGVPVGSVKLWEVQPDLKDAVLWSTDEFKNPGFDSLSRVERSLYMEPNRFIGYYTRAGKPLDFTVRRSPSQPKSLLLTVHVPNPIAPGAIERVFRLVRQGEEVKQNKDGRSHLGLGRMPNPELAIHLWAVRLPETASLVRHVPERGASLSTAGLVQASWVNARLDSNAPPVAMVFEKRK